MRAPQARAAAAHWYAVAPPLAPLVRPGVLVSVPFGAREAIGIVVTTAGRAPTAVDARSIRPLGEVVDPTPLVGSAQLRLARWLAETYLAPLYDALELVLPPAWAQLVDFELRPTPALPKDPRRLGPFQRRFLELVQENPRRRPTLASLRARIGSAAAEALVRRLRLRGWVTAWPVLRWPGRQGQAAAAKSHAVASAQSPLDGTWRGRAEGGGAALSPGFPRARATAPPARPPSLLLEPDPERRLEFYELQVRDALARGQQCLVLFPDVQPAAAAHARLAALAPERTALFHGALSPAARLRVWQRARAGAIDVIVGPRSAVFAPLPHLGLVIVDAEEDGAYKHEASPRYHARDTALELARECGAEALLGTTVPDACTWWQMQQGRFHVVRTQQSPAGRPQAPPRRPVELVDLRVERRVGRRQLVGRTLHQALQATLSTGVQAILLLNRRGSASTVLCRSCGFVFRCARCGVAVIQHRAAAELLCHQCGWTRPLPLLCARCRSPRLRARSTGTQALEDDVHALFPEARVFRWDADTDWGAVGRERVLGDFSASRVQVLIGTQAILRERDLPRVPLVGVVSADDGLHLPDFRAAERAFRLLFHAVQLALLGDGQTQPGRVIVQSHTPDHYCLHALASDDPDRLERFFAAELAERRELGQPPFSRLARLLYAHRDVGRCVAEAERLAAYLREQLPRSGSGIEILGPAPAYYPRLRDRYRWHIIVRGADMRPLAGLIPPGWSIDVDPVYLL